MIDHIFVINLSSRVSNSDAEIMAATVQKQVSDNVAPAWSISAPTIEFVADRNTLASGSIIVSIEDSPDVSDALGYHTDIDNLSSGFVFCNPVLDNEGVVLFDNNNPQNTSVSSVLSHEMLELLIDPDVNGWNNDGKGADWAKEICDSVENSSYAVSVNGTNTSVSNFALPTYFDPNGKAPFDFLHHLSAPFTIEPGGYSVVRRDGVEQQVFGEKFLEWKKATKAHKYSRFARRQKKSAL